MTQPVVLAFVAMGGLAVLGVFMWLERSGRREVVFGVILVLLVVEVVLYPGQGDVPSVIFNPTFGGQAFRLVELTIPLALFARFLVHGLPGRVTVADLAWIAFLLWWLEGTAVGLMGHNPVQDVLFNGKAIIFIGGGYALTSRLDLSRLLSARTCSWLIGLLSIAAVTLSIMTMTGRVIAVSLPLIPLDNFGPYQGDPSTIVWTLAVPLALVELCRRHPSALRMTALLVLLVSPLAGNQRASLIGLAAAVVIAVAAMLLPTWRERLTGRRMRVVVPAVGLLLVTASGGPFAVGLGTSAAGLTSRVVTTFTAQGKQESAQARVVLWNEAEKLIAERPVLGWGQGQWVVIPASRTTLAEATPTHNIALDLLLRNGAVELLLFLIAFLLTARDGLRVWRIHPDSRVAAMALGCVAALIGLVAKGMVESVFDQVRLSTMFGFLLGAVACAANSVAAARVAEHSPAPGEPTGPSRRARAVPQPLTDW